MKKLFTQITKLFTILLFLGGMSSAAWSQCVTPVITSIGNTGPACAGTSVTLNATGTVGGISSSSIKMAGVGANAGNQSFNQVFSSGDRPGSIDRISMTQFDAIFAGLSTDADRATALKARYDVLMFTWASPIDYNITWGLITAYLNAGGSVFVDGDYANIVRFNDGTANSVVGVGSGTTGGCNYSLVSPAPFPTLVANGVNGCFANDHLYVQSFPSWMATYITAGGRNLAVAGIYPSGNNGRLIIQGPDQDFHAYRGGGGTASNQYQIILNQLDFLTANQAGFTWTGPNGFTSNEANPIISNLTAANAGVYTATLTNSNGGCSVSATTTVVVNSAEIPTITASGKTDLCPGNSVTLTASAGGSYLWNTGATSQSILVSTAGNYTVKVAGTNGCLGTSLATAVRVNAAYCNQPPVVVAKALTLSAGANCSANAVATAFDNGSTDPDGDAITFTVSPAGPYLIGVTAVTLSATDTKGASSSIVTTVTVVDDTAPTVITQNVTIQLDANGNASITVADINNGSTDNCGIATIVLSKTAFDCSNFGANTVTLTVTDIHGNVSTKDATVTVEDNVAPIVLTQNRTIQLNSSGLATITAGDINNGSTDNCGIASIVLSKTAFDCSNYGVNTVTLTVTDIHGNVASQTATVTVEDNVAPIVLTQNLSIPLSGGTATITAAQINNGSTDNCGIASMTIDKTSFDCSTIGNHTVTLTVTDIHGNVASKTATVTIVGELTSSSIASAPTSGTYTGGVSTNLYLGYGAQSTTLQVSNIVVGGNGTNPTSYTYAWSGSATSQLSSTTSASPVFTPTAAGYYTFNVIVTNKYGCKSAASISICVKDIREVDKKGSYTGKVYICHAPPGNVGNTNTLSISVNAVASHLSQHSYDRLGSCADAPCTGTTGTLATIGTGATDLQVIKLEVKESGPSKLIAYPNPFAQLTTVSFSVPYAEENAVLDIYDITGAKIQNLYQGKTNADQTYEVKFDGQHVSAGTYFFRLITSKEVKNFKVIMK